MDKLRPALDTQGGMNTSSRRFPARSRLAALVFLTAIASASAAGDRLRVSVYCTAGDVQHHLATPEGRQRVLLALQPLGVSRLFLEGRRGDEYVAPEQLREVRDFFASHKIQCSGGIATVPGQKFGVRQAGGLSWLNWESPKVRADVAGFFTENAPIFDTLIVDDFFCTGDVSPEADRARGSRSWEEYRRDLLVSMITPVITDPTRAASPRTRLIIKYPQWYDRFHLFGYDPRRMSPRFDQVWVGTEVRDPGTRRMGFVQPTEGYMNFRWLTSIAGRKVAGAWFDHIECSAQNFVDQAFGSVLAGAGELTLFRLGDVMEGHPGDALLAARLPELQTLAARIRGKTRLGVPFYKPPNGDSSENLYLADYLGMIGLPILPVSDYPAEAKVAFLPVQAAGDPKLLQKMERHLKTGATLVATPALLRALGTDAASLAGVKLGPTSQPSTTGQIRIAGESVKLDPPLELDASVEPVACKIRSTAVLATNQIPFLTTQAVGKGHLLVLNVRTFSEQDFRDAGEWVLSPKQLGLPRIPQQLADQIRASVLHPLDVELRAPAGVGLFLIGRETWLYSLRDEAVRIVFRGESSNLPAHQLIQIR